MGRQTNSSMVGSGFHDLLSSFSGGLVSGVTQLSSLGTDHDGYVLCSDQVQSCSSIVSLWTTMSVENHGFPIGVPNQHDYTTRGG